MPDVSYDGDFTTAQQCGPAIPEFPFPTDPLAYVYRVPYCQLRANYAPLARGTVGPYGGTATGVDKNFHEVGAGGVVEFHREFALTPNARDEWESFVYPYHMTFVTAFGASICADPFAYTLKSRVHYDYFLTDDPNSIPTPRAMTVQQTCIGIALLHGDLRLVSPGQEILGEDATIRNWNGKIYERKQRYIRWIDFWSIFTP